MESFEIHAASRALAKVALFDKLGQFYGTATPLLVSPEEFKALLSGPAQFDLVDAYKAGEVLLISCVKGEQSLIRVVSYRDALADGQARITLVTPRFDGIWRDSYPEFSKDQHGDPVVVD